MSNELSYYLILSAILFALGIYGVMSRRNIIAMLISLELILNACNINFVAFSKFTITNPALGQLFAIFVIALAAAEICVGLSIALMLVRKGKSVFINKAKELKG